MTFFTSRPTPPERAPHNSTDHETATRWPRLLAAGVLTGAARTVGAALAGLVITWWRHD